MREVTWVVIDESRAATGRSAASSSPPRHVRPVRRACRPSHDADRRHRPARLAGARSRPSPASPTRAVSASATRCSARARRRSSSSRPGRSSTRASGRARSPTSPATSGSSRSTRAATAAPTAPTAPSDYGPRKDAAGRPRGPRRHRHRPTACSSRHCAIAGGALLLAADHPERVAGAVFMSPGAAASPRRGPSAPAIRFDAELPEYEGWAKANRHYWEQRLPRLPRVLLRPLLPEPHSTKQPEDAVGWGLETAPETLAHTIAAPDTDEPTDARADGPAPVPAARHPGRRGPA